MKISIIGTGRMARNLAIGWLKAGHDVVFGSRAPDSKGALTEQAAGSSVMEPVNALRDAEVIVLAIPFTSVETFAREHAAALRHKLVIDITNPFDNLPDNRVAGAELTAQAIGADARVVAAFKSNFWRTLLEPTDPHTGQRRDVLLAGDDETDKETVASLVDDLGFRPVDCGSLHNARILDGMVPLMIELDQRYAAGAARVSWKLLG